MNHTLVFTLGRGTKQKESSRYRTATYCFPDGTVSHSSPFFGLCLLEWLREKKQVSPDLVIVLGTQGSIWDALLESVPNALDDKVLALSEELASKVRDNCVREVDLAPLEIWLKEQHQVTFQLRLVPEGVDHAGQMQTLQVLAEAVPLKCTLHMCVTHGLRHLPMLQMLSVFHLSQTHQITMGGLYYGALELGNNGHECPVVELTGAADLQKWNLALHTLGTTGRLSALAEAAENEVPQLAKKLQLADQRLAVNRTGSAAVAAKEAIKLIKDHDLPGAGRLFSEAAIKRLSWAGQHGLGQKQYLLAAQALNNGDLMRCAILCLEGFTSKLLSDNIDENDYHSREEAWKNFLDDIQGEERKDFKTLEYLRNAIAHGTSSDANHVKALLNNHDKLVSFLKKMLKKLANFPPA